MSTVNFIDEMSQDFLDYCYQTNVERAFPAIDGLKPVHRACLFDMYRKKYLPNKPHVKSAKVSGGVMGELWPHGDVSIYESFARMAQDFTNNIPLCEFHGSCGNQMNPAPASQRYTEVRLSKAGLRMFEGLNKRSVNFIPNFDETLEWPEVLPSPIPYLFINGSEGIGTTISQKFLPYDPKEMTEAYKRYVETGEIDYTLVPSFPSGGTVINKDEAVNILKTGKGKVILRATAYIEDQDIIVTELCYQTCVRDLMEKEFVKLFKEDALPGVSDIENLSGCDGIQIKFTCEDGYNPNDVLEMLYQKTSLQKSYSANQNLLINKVPKLINLEEYFKLLLEHNDDCFIRELSFDKQKYHNIKEINEGLLIAINSIDEVISIVKSSDNKSDAGKRLMDRFKFTETQVDAILKMTISRLTKLDKSSIKDTIENAISELDNIESYLSDDQKRKVKISHDIEEILVTLPAKRKSKAIQMNISKSKDKEEINLEPVEDVAVILTMNHDIKKFNIKELDSYKKKSKKGTNNKELVKEIVSCTTEDKLLCFTSLGKVHSLKVKDIPTKSIGTRGTSVSNLLKLEQGEKVIFITELAKDKKHILFFTEKGMIKKSELSLYADVKKATKALGLNEGDSLVSAVLCNDSKVIMASSGGKWIYFDTANINSVGKTAKGVKGMNIGDDKVISAFAVESEYIGIITVSGLCKKVAISSLTLQGRGGKGNLYSKEDAVSIFDINNDDLIYIQGENKSIIIEAKTMPEVKNVSLTMGNIAIKETRVVDAFKL